MITFYGEGRVLRRKKGSYGFGRAHLNPLSQKDYPGNLGLGKRCLAPIPIKRTLRLLKSGTINHTITVAGLNSWPWT